MNKLIKIRDVSTKYDISARTLRYYEDMGLITSTRSNDYAYRLYDETAVKRLEQILILRKLNISIKDIQRIFNTSGSEVVLDVLGKKVEDIDDEVALLYELKEVVLEFIHQIEQADFSKGSDVKMLYERAKEIESQLINVTYSGNPSNVSRLLDVTEKMKRAPEVRIIRINPFKAFSSGLDTIDNVMGNFQQWQEEHNHLVKKLMYGVRVDSVHQLHKNKDTINSCPYFYAESRLSARIGVFSMQKCKGRKLNKGTYLSKLQK